MLNIRRDNQEASGTHGWQVTIQRGYRAYSRMFPDLRHGGRAQALAAARVFREPVLTRHPPLTRGAQCAILRRIIDPEPPA